jgi:hypothetical protein
VTNSELATRLSSLDWTQCSLQHQLAVAAAISSLQGAAPLAASAPITCGAFAHGDVWDCARCGSWNIGEVRPCNRTPVKALPVYENVVALVRPGTQPSLRHVTLLHLDGRQFATAGFLPGLASDPWAWICETVATELDVSEEAVGCLEPDESDGGGDFVTVDGLPVYRVAIGGRAHA